MFEEFFSQSLKGSTEWLGEYSHIKYDSNLNSPGLLCGRDHSKGTSLSRNTTLWALDKNSKLEERGERAYRYGYLRIYLFEIFLRRSSRFRGWPYSTSVQTLIPTFYGHWKCRKLPSIWIIGTTVKRDMAARVLAFSFRHDITRCLISINFSELRVRGTCRQDW